MKPSFPWAKTIDEQSFARVFTRVGYLAEPNIKTTTKNYNFFILASGMTVNGDVA